MTRSLTKRVGYRIAQVFCRLVGICFFAYRCHGRELVPPSGPVLVCPNHQSFFDPVVVGMAMDRRLNYLARKTLFRFFLFRWLIQFLDTIPIDREGSGLAGLKETLRRLKRQEMVLMFPEGTRTLDGAIGPLKPGFLTLARRSGACLLPVGIDGAYEAWPRTAPWPRRTTITVTIGAPITPAQIAQLTDEQLLALLDQEMRACHNSARRRSPVAHASELPRIDSDLPPEGESSHS